MGVSFARPGLAAWSPFVQEADAGPTWGFDVGAASATDDTDQINQVLTDHAGQVVRLRAGESYRISAPLIISSGTTLDATGATITLIAGSNCNMLRNAADVAGTGRDTNITVKGGTWDRGAVGGTGDNLTLMSLKFVRVDGLTVTDLTYTSTSGKYGIHLNACTRFLVARCQFDCASDGVHLSGACHDGTIADIFGDTGDDVISLTCNDYSAYAPAAADLGDMFNINIERVRATPSNTANAVKLLPGSNGATEYDIYNVTVRDVYVSAPSSAVYIGSAPDQANTTGGTVSSVTVDGVRNMGAGHCVLFYYCTGSGFALRDIGSPTASSKYSVEVGKSCTIGDITVSDCYWTPQASTYAVHMATGSPYSTITTLRLSNIRHNPATKSGGVVDTVSTSNALTNLFVDHLYVDQAAWAIGQFYTTTNLFLSGVNGVNISGWVYVPTGGTVDVRGADGMIGNVNDVNVAGTVKSRSLGFRVDVANLTQADGDLAYNSNAARSCGVGPVISNGSAWKHLYTGNTY